MAAGRERQADDVATMVEVLKLAHNKLTDAAGVLLAKSLIESAGVLAGDGMGAEGEEGDTLCSDQAVAQAGEAGHAWNDFFHDNIHRDDYCADMTCRAHAATCGGTATSDACPVCEQELRPCSMCALRGASV